MWDYPTQFALVLQNLTELDVSENSIENLDLSAVEQLQVLQCSRNSITHLTLYGRHLTSIIAGNNSKNFRFLRNRRRDFHDFLNASQLHSETHKT